MAIICREHRLLFIMVPGTGCSVVGRVLQQNLGGTFFPEYPVRKEGQTVLARKHNNLEEILAHGLMNPAEREDYLVFATVRNPFDRWVTYYQRYVGDWLEYHEGVSRRSIERDRKRFDLCEDEVERRHQQLGRRSARLQRRRKMLRAIGFNPWMKGTLLRWWWDDQNGKRGSIREYAFPMLEGVDVVMRQEKLNEGLNIILAAAGVDERIELPRKNETGGKKSYVEYYSWSTRRLAEIVLGGEMKRFGYEFGGTAPSPKVVPLSKRWSNL